jgi:hypothetical protein
MSSTAGAPKARPGVFLRHHCNEGAVREFWSYTGTMLGLTLLADIYERGFTEGIGWSDALLCQVKQELLQLEKHWSSLNYDDELMSDLTTRLQDIRRAIAVAEEQDGVVTIG